MTSPRSYGSCGAGLTGGEKTHYAASLMSAADQQIPDDTRVVLEELITETGR